MAVESPPTFEQNETYSAEQLRRATMFPYRGAGGVGTITGGVIGASDCTTAAPGSGMSVNIAVGEMLVPGTVGATQSGYYCYVSSITNLAITASNPSNPRIDVPCGTVDDKAYTGSVDDFKLQVVTGTPAGSPVVPSTPASSLALSNVAVPASATNIITGDITDKRIGIGSSTLPAGAIINMAGAVTVGFLACDGSAVSRTTFANLFAYLNASSLPWGSGNGTTTFNVPDLRGRAAIGAGTGTAAGASAWALGSRPTSGNGGEEQHTLTTGEIPSHVHGSPDGHNFITDASTPLSIITGGSGGAAAGTSTAAAGGGGGHNIMQPIGVVTRQIKT